MYMFQISNIYHFQNNETSFIHKTDDNNIV